MDKNCGFKQRLFKENVNYRTQELAALADTIKILNDDDNALELFEKTPPGANSFVQMQVSEKSTKARASLRHHGQRRDFISMALHGNRQVNDDSKKEYCEEQFDLSDAKKKLEDGIKALDKEVAEATENLYGKFRTRSSRHKTNKHVIVRVLVCNNVVEQP